MYILSSGLKIGRCVYVIVMLEECSKNRKSSNKIGAVGTSAIGPTCMPNFIKIGGGQEHCWLISYGMSSAGICIASLEPFL